MNLRKYQQDAVDAVFDFAEKCPGQSGVIVIPTGGGKTLVMAEIIRRFFSNNQDCRGMLLSHVKELLEQSEKTCERISISTNLPLNSIGVYSAKMNRRERKALTIASIQSVHKKADFFGALDFVLIDEAHLISPNENTMYRKFLSLARIRNSRLLVIGLTATPYRQLSGLIFGKDKFFDQCCYATSVKNLISDGYLAPLVTKGIGNPDLKKVKVRGGDFLTSSLSIFMQNQNLVDRGVSEAVAKAVGRKSILVFSTTIKHGEMILQKLRDLGEESSHMVTGQTDTRIRDFRVNQFKNQEIRWLVNVAVFTTGFDAPNVDCVVVMRPTMSRGLWYQMVGRGFRLSPGKKDCLVLDFGGNAIRLGSIDEMQVDANGIEHSPAEQKECPKCSTIIKASHLVCPECGYFKIKHDSLVQDKLFKVSPTQTWGEIIDINKNGKEYEIINSTYTIHKKNPEAAPCIKECHETSMGLVITCYRSLKKGLEYPLIKWMKKIKLLEEDAPEHPWKIKKDELQKQRFLDSIAKPSSICAYKNEKGFWAIAQYKFPQPVIN